MFDNFNDIDFELETSIRKIKESKYFAEIFYQKHPGNKSLYYLTSLGMEEFKKFVDPEIYLSKNTTAYTIIPEESKTFRYKIKYDRNDLKNFYNELKNFLMKQRSYLLRGADYQYYFDKNIPFYLYVEKFDESTPIRINMNIIKEKIL